MAKLFTFALSLLGDILCIVLFWRYKKICYGNIGREMIHPLAPYSYNGCPREKFYELYELSKCRDITEEDFNRLMYETRHPTQEQIRQSYEISRDTRMFFPRPFFFR